MFDTQPALFNMIMDSGAISFLAVFSHCQVVIIQILYVLLQLSLDS
jgi:hypothetical protein